MQATGFPEAPVRRESRQIVPDVCPACRRGENDRQCAASRGRAGEAWWCSYEFLVPQSVIRTYGRNIWPLTAFAAERVELWGRSAVNQKPPFTFSFNDNPRSRRRLIGPCF